MNATRPIEIVRPKTAPSRGRVHLDIGLGALCGRVSMLTTNDPLKATCRNCTARFDDIRAREAQR